MRTQLSSDDAKIIYQNAGGMYDQYDARAVAVPVIASAGAHDGDVVTANGTRLQVGVIQDSGVAERCKSLYAQTTRDAGKATDIAENARFVQVSYPIPVPPCNPWRGA